LPVNSRASRDSTSDTKGHRGDRVLFSKWNSFSRIGVYERTHGDWSLSSAYHGELPNTRFMDIDSAASTPILGLAPDLSNAQYLRYELTALAYQLKDPGFSALVIGPGGGRDLATARLCASRRRRRNQPIIANDVAWLVQRVFADYTHLRAALRSTMGAFVW
jgi:hypothetical protein